MVRQSAFIDVFIPAPSPPTLGEAPTCWAGRQMAACSLTYWNDADATRQRPALQRYDGCLPRGAFRATGGWAPTGA